MWRFPFCNTQISFFLFWNIDPLNPFKRKRRVSVFKFHPILPRERVSNEHHFDVFETMASNDNQVYLTLEALVMMLDNLSSGGKILFPLKSCNYIIYRITVENSKNFFLHIFVLFTFSIFVLFLFFVLFLSISICNSLGDIKISFLKWFFCILFPIPCPCIYNLQQKWITFEQAQRGHVILSTSGTDLVSTWNRRRNCVSTSTSYIGSFDVCSLSRRVIDVDSVVSTTYCFDFKIIHCRISDIILEYDVNSFTTKFNKRTAFVPFCFHN